MKNPEFASRNGARFSIQTWAVAFIALMTSGLLAGCAAGLPARSPAGAAAPSLSPRELHRVADYFKPHVYVLNHPILVYHWGQTGGAYSPKTDGRQSSDPAGFQYARDAAAAFWHGRTQPSEDNYYGSGFYLAADPVASRTFGGSPHEQTWILTQVRLAAGLLMLDLTVDEKQVIAPEIRALVLWNPEILSAGDVRIFTANTADAPGDRLSLQSLFFKAVTDDHFAGARYPINLTKDRLPQEEVLRLSYDLPVYTTLLWNDLAGKSTDPEIGSWIKQNLFGCAETSALSHF